MLSLSEGALTHDTLQNIGLKALLLRDHLPDLDLPTTIRYLSGLSDDNLIKLRTGSFGSLAFDIVFSPGIIPKKREEKYREAYKDFFRRQYDRELFNQDEMFMFQIEDDFYYDPKQGPNDSKFLAEWIGNLRAVAIMLQTYRPNEMASMAININLIEAALCRMAENGESWPDDLFFALPYSMQERLGTLREQIAEETSQGRNLAPRQFFQMANELEFKERDFLRGAIHDRVDMVISQIASHRTSQPSEQNRSLQFDPGVDWKHPTERQFRQVNLSALMRNPEQAQSWTHLLLGTGKTASLPPLSRVEDNI